MNFLTRVLAACIIIGALAVALFGQAQTDCDFNSVTEYQRYQSDGEWIVFIVSSKLKRECMISFAKKIHDQLPVTRLEFFDAKGPELDQYILSASHGLDETYFYPERWLGKHQVASLYVFPDGHGPSDCEWTLMFEKKGADASIGRGPCRSF
jgi:hypothetical protein